MAFAAVKHTARTFENESVESVVKRQGLDRTADLRLSDACCAKLNQRFKQWVSPRSARRVPVMQQQPS